MEWKRDELKQGTGGTKRQILLAKESMIIIQM